MMFWILVGLMSLLALAFVLLPIVRPGMGRKPLLITGLVLGVPLVAVMVYQKLGTPAATNTPVAMPMPAMPPMGAGNMPPMPAGAMPTNHPPSNVMNMDLSQLADKLADKLKSQPNNADGWSLLARTYLEIKKYKEASEAFEKAVKLLPNDSILLADYAKASLGANGGIYDMKVRDLIGRALKINPTNVRANILLASEYFNETKYDKAIDVWNKVLLVPGLAEDVKKEVQDKIEVSKNMKTK